MANVDAPIGFRTFGPVKSYRPFDIESATACYINDLIAMGSDGYVDAAAAAGEVIVGPTQNYHAANAGLTTIVVADDPDQLLIAQNDDTTLSQDNVGNRGDHAAGSGSSTTLLSGHELDGSDVAAKEAGFLILDLLDAPGNDWGVNCDMILRCCEHLYTQQGTGYV